MLKSQVAFNELDVFMDHRQKINHHNQYKLLSLVEFSLFYNIKLFSKHHKPEIISFVSYNKYK